MKPKMSQSELGRRVGLSSSSVSLIESGENNPRQTTLIALGVTLGVRPEWLKTGDGARDDMDDSRRRWLAIFDAMDEDMREWALENMASVVADVKKWLSQSR